MSKKKPSPKGEKLPPPPVKAPPPPKGPPTQQQQVVPPGGPVTVERPKCDCKTDPVPIRRTTSELPPDGNFTYRYVIDVSSEVTCDLDTPNECQYRYIAEARVERRRAPNQRWQLDPNRKMFIKSFGVVDDVNQDDTPARPDSPRYEFSVSRAKAPQTELTRVTFTVAPSVRVGANLKGSEEVMLCVPKGPPPRCP